MVDNRPRSHLSNITTSTLATRGLPREEREDIAQYLCYYHGGEVSAESTFEEVTAYIPRVLDKIASKLEHSLRDLERRAG